MKLINSSFLFVLVSALLWSCGGAEGEKQVNTADSLRNPLDTMPKLQGNDFTHIHEGEGYSFHIQAKNGEMTDLLVFTVGMENEYKDSMQVEGQVVNSLMLDVNGDGHQEFYLVVSPTDDSGNLNLMGFGSNRGKSMSIIHVDDAKEPRQVNTDDLRVENDRLYRTFSANGKEKIYTYRLLQGEGGYILKAIPADTVELD